MDLILSGRINTNNRRPRFSKTGYRTADYFNKNGMHNTELRVAIYTLLKDRTHEHAKQRFWKLIPMMVSQALRGMGLTTEDVPDQGLLLRCTWDDKWADTIVEKQKEEENRQRIKQLADNVSVWQSMLEPHITASQKKLEAAKPTAVVVPLISFDDDVISEQPAKTKSAMEDLMELELSHVPQMTGVEMMAYYKALGL